MPHRNARHWLPLSATPPASALAAIVTGCALLGAVGCESWRTVKVDHPVLGPPPPRISWNDKPTVGKARVALASADEASMLADAPASGAISQLDSASSDEAINDLTVVAIINGEAILAGDMLLPYRPQLMRAAAAQASPAEVDQFKRAAIKKDLNHRIEQTLLVQALRLMLKKEQLAKIDEPLTKAFNEQAQKMMDQLKVNSKAELDEKLREQGSSLEDYSAIFKTQQLAMTYLHAKAADGLPVVGRQEILTYYQAHEADYISQPRVRFQLLLVGFPRGGGRAEAQVKMNAALAELRAGATFGDVAARYSDGPRADRGGQWDWLAPGDYADATVDKALFALPVGSVSDLIETRSSLVVVKVTEREEGGKRSLAEVQEDIRHTLEIADRKRATENLIAKLKEKAIINIFVQ